MTIRGATARDGTTCALRRTLSLGQQRTWRAGSGQSPWPSATSRMFQGGSVAMDGSVKPGTGGKGLAKSPGALAGLKVVDLTRVLGGPYCTMILSDHGADVIKIEPPQGDEVRDWAPPFHEDDASYFIGINRNKRAIALDIGKPEGQKVLLRLLEGADLLIENFKPGTMEKWGIGYDDLSLRFPRLIHCRISGFGPD